MTRPTRLRLLIVGALVMSGMTLRAEGDPSSPWYLERPRSATAELPDGVPAIVTELELLLRDGGVPGFYDGQFAATAERFEELAAVALDPDLHHVIRTLAVMALHEADQGPRLVETLRPLLIEVGEEYFHEHKMTMRRLEQRLVVVGEEAEADLRQELDVDLSRHARFALAKAGHPEALMARIRLLEAKVAPQRRLVLDRRANENDPNVFFYRGLWFSIAYHYQQFDDYENAAIWFRALTENLNGLGSRWAHYNLACIAALQGQPELALEELTDAIANGFADVAWMDEDGDLASLRGRQEYQALRAELGAEDEISNAGALEGLPASNPPKGP